MYKKFLKEENTERKNELFNKYKAIRNIVVALCRASKKVYYEKFFSENLKNIKKHGMVSIQ